ncbi:hypothetical protein ACFFHF_17215 [Robertmurraya beringensis]|uniref:Uncharacterized protein n=1 Tax=Robertmurraya beringensis TaxID=641660 RepID=A0ABV6KUE5_9BACI
MKFIKNNDGYNQGYEVVKDGEVIGFVYKTTLIDLTVMWKNNKNDDLFITRKDASEALL